jgi:hypothetical protein
MKRTDLITNIKLRSAPLETKLAEENKNALLSRETLAKRVTPYTNSERTLTTSNTSSLDSERKKQRIRMKLIDLEIQLPLKKESAKTMMLNLRVLTTMSTRLRRNLSSSVRLLTKKTSNLEELMRLLIKPLLSFQEPRMSTPDLWLKLNLSRETLMDN